MTIQQMREKRDEVAKKARAHLEEHKSKWGGPKGRNQEIYNQLVDEIADIDSSIANEERQLQIEAVEAHARVIVEDSLEGPGKKQAELEIKAFHKWLRNGKDGLTEEERTALATRTRRFQDVMSTTTDAEGGYTAPDIFSATLLEALKEFGGMREVATILRTSSGHNWEMPTTDATSEVGEIVAQNAAATAADFTFGTKTLSSYKYSSKEVAVPFELLQDTAINLEAHINSRLAMRIARITNTHFTTGTGAGQPTGIATGLTVGKQGATGQTLTVVYNDLVDLEHSIDPAYRRSGKCRWMMHDSSVKVLKKLVDSTGRPLWLPGLSSVKDGFPDTIMGYAYAVNQDVAVMAANARSILFGDFSHYHIRDIMAVQLFRMTDSNFTRKGQVGFLAFSRHDGKLLDVGGAVKAYQNSAT